jgi:hypothetical protein
MKEIYLNDKDAITILSKKDSKCWFFKIENNILCIEYNSPNKIVFNISHHLIKIVLFIFSF